MTGLAAFSFMGAFAQQINPMTEAVLRNYAEILTENPKDYYTLYDRASQYYSLGDYTRALSDLDMALEYTPAADKDYIEAEYILKANVLTAQKNYKEALDAINAALKINPTSPTALYVGGNLYLMMEEPAEALKMFKSLQRENPRSQDAFYGMAKANALLGNNLEAENLIKEIENLGKQSFLTYCRIGDLYSDMGNVKEATTNYVIAYTMEDNSLRPVESLKLMAKKDETTVMETLNSLISSKPDNLAINYAKAIVAFDAGNYKEAEKACKEIAANSDDDSAAVYRMMAMAQLAQNNTNEAKSSIAAAERLSPSDSGVLLDKAEIYMVEDPAVSYNAATSALNLIPDDEAAQMLAAKTAILNGKYPEALNLLNNIILSNPANIKALLLRGFLNTEYLNDGKAGVADYTRASNVKVEGNVSDMIYTALGKAKINKKLDADGIISDAVKKAGTNKELLYQISVYYAQTGDLEKAKQFADKALLNGYNNLYNLQTNKEPLFNLIPIRHLLGN